MKIWKLLLSSILLTIIVVIFKQIISSNFALPSFFLTQSRAVYQNVDQEFINHKADVSKVSAGSNNDYITDCSIVFYWNHYADSWEEFKANYQDLDLRINFTIDFNLNNIKWQNSNLHVPLSKMNTSNSNWISIYQINLTTTQPSRWDNTHGELFYACWYSSKSVNIRFKMVTWASNNYDNYYFTIDTRSVSSRTTYDYQSIESLLNEKVNNQTLVLTSDYSTSIQDERNKPSEKTALDNLMKNALGQYYERWCPYILSYNYDYAINQATISIKFNDPNLKKNILWNFKITITFNLTQDYWNKAFEERLTIITRTNYWF